MRWLAVIVALVWGAEPAVADALRDFRAQIRRLDKQERAYWEEYNNRFVKACSAWYEPAKQDKRHKALGVDGDFTEMRLLYEECAAIEKLRGAACLELARSGHAKATGELFKLLLQTTLKVDKTEKELREENDRVYAALFDQRPGVRRHALAFREQLLGEALAAAPDDPKIFGQHGWGRARKQDAKHYGSVTGRVAWLDVAGARRTAARMLIYNLSATDPRLRIAALEALMRFGRDQQWDLMRLLRDEQVVVQRALLAAIPHATEVNYGWIGPLMDYFPVVQGLRRADARGALKALTGRDFGDDPKPWRAWYLEHADEIRYGSFKPAARPEGAEPDRRPPRATTFYEQRIESNRILFMLDGSWALQVPAEAAVQEERHWWHWRRGDWKGKHESHQDVLVRQTGKALARLQGDSRFRILMIGHHSNKEDVIGLFPDVKSLHPDARSRKRAVDYLAGYKYSWINYDLHYALLRALQLPDIDTVLLVYNGHLVAGRFLLPEALVADFERRNRWRRYVVHAVRIGDTGPESEKLLKELAARSGGTYTWAEIPPPE